MTLEDLKPYLHAHHSVSMDVDGETYCITDVNDQYWRVQRNDELNEKGHYVDASELVPTLSEFLDLPFKDGESISVMFDRATFYASEK